MLIHTLEAKALTKIEIDEGHDEAVDRIVAAAVKAGARLYGRDGGDIVFPRSDLMTWTMALATEDLDFEICDAEPGIWDDVEIVESHRDHDILYWIDRCRAPVVPADRLGPLALSAFTCAHENALMMDESNEIHALDPRSAAEGYAAILRERYGLAGFERPNGRGIVSIRATDGESRRTHWIASADGAVRPAADEEADTLPSGGIPAVLA